MQKYVAAVLLLVLLLPLGVKVVLVADYALRFDYYATVLCENKDKVEMNCHGKCQLNNNLTIVNKVNPEKPTVPSAAKTEISDFIVNQYSLKTSVFKAKKSHIGIPEVQNHYKGIALAIPTPPPSL